MRGSILKLMTVAAAMIVFGNPAAAGEEKPEYGWKKAGVAGLNLTQNSFDNWAKGGEDAWSWQFNLNATLDRLEEKHEWTNSLKVSYGKSRVGDENTRKSVDEIYFNSVYTYLMGIHIDPYASFLFRSQFAPGYDYGTPDEPRISDLLDPAYLVESAGLSFKPAEYVRMRLGGAAKQTISADYGYADDLETPGEIEDFKNEFGAEFVTDLNLKLDKNILFTSTLEIFSNFHTFRSIDVNWDNMFTAKVSEYIDVSLNIKLLYDEDISPRRQISQTLAVGLTYTLF